MKKDNPVFAQATFFKQLQARDSILIGDQMLYGADLPAVPIGTTLELPSLEGAVPPEVNILGEWRLDTLQGSGKAPLQDVRASLTLTSFDEGEYLLPPFSVVRHLPDGSTDTLHFEGKDILVCTMPVDTATFKIKPIKEQMNYPVTFAEIAPWLGGAVALAGLVAGLVLLGKRLKRKKAELAHVDPPHIIALRKLDAYRGDKFWAPAKQKFFYSGVTDALREYIAARYAVGAMEMTTAELMDSLKDVEMQQDLKQELQELLERADYVKFAKYVASEQENASVLPFSVKFVTSTYEEQIKEESNVL